MPKSDCDICSQDIRTLYNMSAHIVDLNLTMLNLAAASPQSAKILAQGRIVVLRDDVRRRYCRTCLVYNALVLAFSKQCCSCLEGRSSSREYQDVLCSCTQQQGNKSEEDQCVL